MMKNKVLIVVFDKHCNRILISSRNSSTCRGGLVSENNRVEAALSELGIQNKEDVSITHIMDVTTYLEEYISLYVGHLHGPDPVADGCHRYLFWVSVQHLGICSGFLSSAATWFERMIKDYAISLIVDGYIKFPQ